MLKLTYSIPGDKYQTVTVLGNVQGIYDLWFRLSNSVAAIKAHGVGNIEITDLDGNLRNPEKGLNSMVGLDTVMSSLISSI